MERLLEQQRRRLRLCPKARLWPAAVAEAMAQAPDEKGGGPEVIGMGGNNGDGSADAGGGNGVS